MKIKCKECRSFFEFTEGEQRFYAKNGLSQPKRCPVCREECKRRRADPYIGFEETMFRGGGGRGRHTRVHYAPHVVGGFR